ncbi:hypothetical protein L6Q21_05765 [Sandaracinobacter sp. RS1-74]|uniref:hypothetical protein n=1 Tax=Sandaracinobacteroides sayramensis TaxID=2913411 RepID=UPI001ED9EC7D|nr:hypothetical protein [Sandaracinobacteroides sayramensis]MCG2840484.1 hypothetical protein [Sandaracinobacteroides sayramensis]
MDTRRLVLALLLVPLVVFGFLAVRDQAGRERLLPRFDPADVARLELSRGGEALELRRAPSGEWTIPSAADVPGDPARIEAALDRLARLDGRPMEAKAPRPNREPVRLRLLDEQGKPLAEAAFWSREAEALPDGPRLAMEKPPALPLWPSAWSSQQPPRIDPAGVVKAERLTLAGPQPLTDSETAEVATLLGQLSPVGFVAGSRIDWKGARLLRVTLVDGSFIDLAQVPDGEGRYYLRLASDTDAGVRATRRLAFRVSKPLP